MTNDPLVSVVIPTADAAGHLDRCLASLRAQTYDPIELVVVDAYSDDGTAAIAADCDANLVLSDDGMSAARNTGIERASGEFLLSVDADMELEPTVVERCVEAYRAGDGVGGIIVPERSVGDSYWVSVRDFERSFYAGTAVESARFFPMDVVRRVGGYDERVTFFEDSTLPQRVERRTELDTTRRIAGAHVFHHEEGFRLSDWLRKKYSYGTSASQYLREYGDRADEQTSPLSRYATFLTARRFYTKPLLAAGVLVLKTLEFGAAGAGMVGAR